LIDRRSLLEAMVGLLLAPAALARAQASPAGPSVGPASERVLAESPFVYVSPLRSNGQESRCHGEVWYGWIDGSAVVITSARSWKARSVARGLDRARLWVGDYGRVKKMIGSNQAFRTGPSFVAGAERVRTAELLDRLLGIYDKKYPAEIENWREPMRTGFQDGTRVLIRYVPETRT